MARTNRNAAEQTIELAGIRPEDKVLEVGFGPGAGIQLLSQRASRGWIAGIDQSREMVEQANARNAHAVSSRRVDLRHGSVERLPFMDQTFDKVISVNSMQVWRDAPAGLQEIRRVLKTGGKLALCFTVHSGQTKNGILDLIGAAGFAQERMVERPELFCVIAIKPWNSRMSA